MDGPPPQPAQREEAREPENVHLGIGLGPRSRIGLGDPTPEQERFLQRIQEASTFDAARTHVPSWCPRGLHEFE